MKSSRLRYFLHKAGHKKRYQYFKRLMENQSRSAQQLENLQWQALVGMVNYARDNTRFYRDFYPPSDTPVDKNYFQQLPVLEKQHVIHHLDDMLSTDTGHEEVKLGQTSGSTGQPLRFYYNNDKMEFMRAGMMRSYSWCGWRPGEKILNFWGAEKDIKKHAPLKRFWKQFSAAEITLPCQNYSEKDLSTWINIINRYQPVIIQGYASVIAELAHYMVENTLPVKCHLKGVYTTAEVLLPQHKKQIEQAFNCPVFNQYGSREVPNIGLSCRHGNMHIFSDLVYLESVQIDQQEEFLVTSLSNKLMPMIRYRIGDFGQLKNTACPCGMPFPIMEMTIARSNDIIITPAGKRIYPSFFHHLLDFLSDIQRFQFVQKKHDLFHLLYQAGNELSPQQKQQIQDKLNSEFETKINIAFIKSNSIARNQAGKHRFVIAHKQG